MFPGSNSFFNIKQSLNSQLDSLGLESVISHTDSLSKYLQILVRGKELNIFHIGKSNFGLFCCFEGHSESLQAAFDNYLCIHTEEASETTRSTLILPFVFFLEG